ncbi:putative phosphosugar-binding protein [Oikeobacillus pervagus]|uniref:Phosphosugar-binding protein n=1 Tax=Oikeobacillus pervagus TaxID=1325931 RepID=A0AAJ1WI08_9BACI|nr:DUF2529 domain-containing protein [Oikeobacillus pervagus]MDQ0214170.1 putative phosphosugar-binding protein [Oikeobacillus pervagus]
MLKMFTTQLIGLLQRIQNREQYSIEDGARLLAQALAGEGNIYIHGIDEMEGITLEALNGSEPFERGKALRDLSVLNSIDRVLLVSRYSTDEKALLLAEQLIDKNIPFAAISTSIENDAPSLATLADVHIDLGLSKGLIPNDEGERVGYPASIAALYVYFALKLAMDEILEDNDF